MSDPLHGALRDLIAAAIADTRGAEPEAQAEVVMAAIGLLLCPPKPEDRWPILAPDGTLQECPPRAWVRAVRKAVDMLEDATAVRSWRAAMGPHLACIAQMHPKDVRAAEAAIEDRLAKLREQAA